MNTEIEYVDLVKAVKPHGKAIERLFTSATRSATSKLEELLACDALTSGTYHCMAKDKYVHGHNHLESELVRVGKRQPSDYQFFGNALTIDPNGSDKNWERPSDRATLGKHVIYTFEHDDNRDGYLLEQCHWLVSNGTPSQSKVQDLFNELKQFADFRLLNVTYSGNKSLHFHIVFETALMVDRQRGELTSQAVQAGYRAHWFRLKDIVVKHLQSSAQGALDSSLATFTSLRRMPNGTRIVGEKHPLKLKTGSRVRQVVLWEKEVLRNASVTLFHTPNLFSVTSRTSHQVKRIGCPLLTHDELTYAETWLSTHFQETSLILAGIESTTNGYVARFHNSPTDQNPSSLLQEQFYTPELRGKERDQVGILEPLPLPFGDLLSHLAQEVRDTNPFNRTELDVARKRLASFLPYWLHGHRILLVHGSEGVGKSTSIMQHIALARSTGERGLPLMFSFSTYEDALLKMQQFNEMHGVDSDHRSKYVGVLWRSMSLLYADFNNGDALTVDDADDAGVTFWKLVQDKQPSVAAKIKRALEDIWQKIAGRTAVLFTVHQIAHQWADNFTTRQMLSPCFFDVDFDPPKSRESTRLNWLIHDEISTSTFIDTLSQPQMQWLRKLANGAPKVWSSGASRAQRKAYQTFANDNPEDCAVDRVLGQRALRVGLNTFDEILIKDSEEYGFDDFQESKFGCQGGRFYIRNRNWWMEGEKPVADRIVFLTTEVVPSLLAEKMVEGLRYIRPKSRVGRDAIDVIASRRVNSKQAPAIAKRYESSPEWVIANRLGGAENTISPFAVRGRNDLADQDIVQIVTNFHPDHYREFQALGTLLERDDIALLAHVDQMNQSIGRNRGPRNSGASHLMYINLNLFRSIVNKPSANAELRYLLSLRMDEAQRRNARKNTMPKAA